jgi:hypothetical protein
MGKFLQMMSATNGTLAARASQINTQAQIAQQTIVQNLRNEIAQVEIKIQDLTDFAPETTMSLRPGVKSWNPSEWANALQKAKVDLYTLNVELTIALKTLDEFFGEDEDTTDGN